MSNPKINLTILFIILAIQNIFSFEFPQDMSKAEDQYDQGNYENFLQTIQKALIDNSDLKDDIVLNAKIAYSLYQLNRYNESELVWKKIINKSTILLDYFWWYRGLNKLESGDTISALQYWEEGYKKYPDSPIVPKIQFYSAEICAASKNYFAAYRWMNKLYSSGKTAGHEKAFILGQMIKYLNYLDNDSLRNIYVDVLFTRYPAAEESYYWYKYLEIDTDPTRLSATRVKIYLDVLLQNNKAAEGLEFIKKLRKNSALRLDNTMNYYKAEFYFLNRMYKSSYNIFKTLKLNQFKLTTQKNILYQKGRCLYRMRLYKSAQKEFLVLASKFPNWRKSQELLWVVALDYEIKKQFRNARNWYNKIIKYSPNSEYAWKSRFRIGFSYYLEKNYPKAISSFERSINSKIWYLWKDQAKFWKAKSLEAMGHFPLATEIYVDLAEEPLANYYTMKSYLLLSSIDPDTSWRNQPLFFPKNRFFALDAEFDSYVDDFSRVLNLANIFGDDIAEEELSTIKISNEREISYYIALVRLYRKIGDFGEAYKLQLKMINKYFVDLPLTFDSPAVKYLFPLFYDDFVFAMSNELDVEPEMVFAVMRQESAFETDAESRAGAYGLLQLMPGTAKNLHIRYNHDEPWDVGRLIEPDYNIQLGIYYLSSLISRYGDVYPHIFIAYNAGPNRLKKWRKRIQTKDEDIFIESIRFNETRVYVRNCMRNYWVYKIILGSSPLTFYDEIVGGHPILGDN